jgi:hypothetical protein
MRLSLWSICVGDSVPLASLQPLQTLHFVPQLSLLELRFPVCESGLTSLRIHYVPLARSHQRLRLAVTYSAPGKAVLTRIRAFLVPRHRNGCAFLSPTTANLSDRVFAPFYYRASRGGLRRSRRWRGMFGRRATFGPIT